MRIAVQLFFFLMLMFPAGYTRERGAGLALIVILVMIKMLHQQRSGIRLAMPIVVITAACVFVSLLWMVWGAVMNAPGALQVGTVFVVWPLLYMVFIGLLSNMTQLQPFITTITLATFGVEIICVGILLESAGIINLNLISLFEPLNAAVNLLYEGNAQFNISSMSTFAFSLPFLVAKFLQTRQFSRWALLDSFVLFLGIAIILFSGKRAFWIILAISPIVFACLAKIVGEKITLRNILPLILLLFSGVGFALIFFDFSLEIMLDIFLQGFQFSDPNSIAAYRRGEQFDALVKGWEENPLFGAGHGAAAEDKKGELTEAYAYELSYIALLFQVGILGLIVYAMAVGWLYAQSFRIMANNPTTRAALLPLLTGTTCFLFANATNPYLNKFDYLWIIFLPAAFLNASLLHSKSIRERRLHNSTLVISPPTTQKAIEQ